MKDKVDEWLIRLSQSVEDAGGSVAGVLREGATLNGLQFLQRLAKNGLFVCYDKPDTEAEEGYLSMLSPIGLAKVAETNPIARDMLITQALSVGVTKGQIEEYDTWEDVGDEVQRRETLRDFDWVILTERFVKEDDDEWNEVRYMTTNKRWSKEVRFAKKFPTEGDATVGLRSVSKQPDGWPDPRVVMTEKL
jgi:hypothetical protein